MADIHMIPTAAPRMDGIPATPATMPLPMGDSGFAAWPGAELVMPDWAAATHAAPHTAPSGDALARWLAGQAGLSPDFAAVPGTDPALEALAAGLPQLPQMVVKAEGGTPPAIDAAAGDADVPRPEMTATPDLPVAPVAMPVASAPQAAAMTEAPPQPARPVGGVAEPQATPAAVTSTATEPDVAAPLQAGAAAAVTATPLTKRIESSNAPLHPDMPALVAAPLQSGTAAALPATPLPKRTEPGKAPLHPDMPPPDAVTPKAAAIASDRVEQAPPPAAISAAAPGGDSPVAARSADLPAGLADSMAALVHGLEGGRDPSLHGPARGSTAGPAGATVQHDPRPVMQQVAEAVVTARGDRTEIALSPEELGRLRLVMTGADRGQITIWAERPETLDLIRRNADLLTQQLAEAGITAGTLDFRQDERMGRPDQTWRRADGEAGDSLSDGPALPAAAAIRLSQTPLSDRRIDIRL